MAGAGRPPVEVEGMTYTVVIVRAHDGRYLVSVPALDDLATFGDDLPEALRMAEEAILAYLEGLAVVGRQPPPDLDEVPVALGDSREAMVYRIAVREEAAVA
jgi:predicted RNase H-like HicB family nuclease